MVLPIDVPCTLDCMFGPLAVPSEDHFKRWFTNRDEEQRYIRHLLTLPPGSITPVQSFVGVAGAGKTFLRRRFEEICKTAGVKTYVVELDPNRNGDPRPDPAALVAGMVAAFELEAPRSAHALLRLAHAEITQTLDPSALFQDVPKDLLGEVIDSTIVNFHSISLGGALASVVKGLTQAHQRMKTPLVKFLKSVEGESDLAWFAQGQRTDQIRSDLFRRFGLDLLVSNSPLRNNNAIQFAIFIDSVQRADGIFGSRGERNQALSWATELYRNCCSQHGSSQLLVVTFGQTVIELPQIPSHHFATCKLDGLSEKDAILYAREKRGMAEVRVTDVLQLSSETPNSERFHAFALGLACDLALIESGDLSNLAEAESRVGRSIEEILVDRFLFIVGEEDEYRLRKLAVTPNWDNVAAAFALGVADDSAGSISKIDWLHRFSFVSKNADNTFSLHHIFRKVLLRTSKTEQNLMWHREWALYWHSRSVDSLDRFSSLNWLHRIASENEVGLAAWEAEITKALESGDMLRHLNLVEIAREFAETWVSDINWLPATEEARWKLYWGTAQQDATVGPFRHHEAIDALREVLDVFSRETTPLDWALTQNNLGTAYMRLGEIEADGQIFRQAITSYKASLEIRDQEVNLVDWAKTQSNLASAQMLLGLLEGEPSFLRNATDSLERVLKVLTPQDAPIPWAGLQNNLGNAFLAAGKLEGNPELLLKAISSYQHALLIPLRENLPLKWADIQSNLGNAFAALAAASSDGKIFHQAIFAYENALSLQSRETMPLVWAQTQDSLGVSLSELGKIEKNGELLVGSILAHQCALEVLRQKTTPAPWAQAQNNLGCAYLALSDYDQSPEIFGNAIAAFNNALEIYKRDTMPFEWAGTQNNLGNLLQKFGSREGNSENLRLAIISYESALEVFIDDAAPFRMAGTQNNLGNTLLELGKLDGNEDTLRQAITAFESALATLPQGSSRVHTTGIQVNLGNGLMVLGELQGDEDLIRRALSCFKSTLQVLGPETLPDLWILAQRNIKRAYKILGE